MRHLLPTVLVLGVVACRGSGDEPPSSAAAATESDRLEAVRIVAGTNHTCAVGHDGDVRCWGANATGAAGRLTQEGGRGDQGAIGIAKFPGPVLDIAAGNLSTCATVLADPFHLATTLRLPDDGPVTSPNVMTAIVQIYCWGSPNLRTCNETVGASPTGSDEGAPQQLCGIDGLTMPAELAFGTANARSSVTAFAMNGAEDLCVGKLKASETTQVGPDGATSSPAQGDGLECFRGLTRRSFPELAGKTISKISMDPIYTCAIADGALYCWGNNEFGQLGDGTKNDAASPVRITSLPGTVKDVAASNLHTCAITTAGTFCVGSNAQGMLGDGSSVFTSTAWVAVAGLPDGGATAIVAGTGRTCAIAAGDVYCWGFNGFGGIGNGANGAMSVPTPVKIRGLQGKVAAITIGAAHDCALTDAGVQCWGGNDHGQVGGALDAFKSPESPDPVFVRAKPL
jgi:hypothetical protein